MFGFIINIHILYFIYVSLFLTNHMTYFIFQFFFLSFFFHPKALKMGRWTSVILLNLLFSVSTKGLCYGLLLKKKKKKNKLVLHEKKTHSYMVVVQTSGQGRRQNRFLADVIIVLLFII